MDAQHRDGAAGEPRAAVHDLLRPGLADASRRAHGQTVWRLGRAHGQLGLTCGPQQVLERPRRVGEHRPGALLHHAATVEYDDVVGPSGRGQSVGDHNAGPSDEQAFRRAYDAALGHRVHPRGGLVEHYDLHVAHQQTRKCHQLLLACRQGGPAGAEDGVEPLGQAADPLGEPELCHGPVDQGRRYIGEQGDVLGQGSREHLSPLGHHPDRGAQVLQV